MKQIVLFVLILITLTGCEDLVNQNFEASGEVHKAKGTIEKPNSEVAEKSGQQSPETPPKKDLQKETDRKYPTEQELAMTINKLKKEFMDTYKIDEEHIAQPFTYDINNDGSDEIILSTLKDFHFEEYDFYIGIYDAVDGKEIVTKKLLSSAETASQAVQLRAIKNETFGNCLVLVQTYRGYGATILALKNKELVEIDSFGTYYGGETEMIVDLDNDGFHEFIGANIDLSIGNERLSRADAIANDVEYWWDKEKQQYMEVVYGEDGLTDDQRKPVGELTTEKALQILQVAYDVQVSWYEPLDKEEARKLLRPFFSNNFLYIFMNNGVVYDKGMIPRYSISDDYRFLLPAYEEDAPVDLEISSDGLTAYVSQDNEVSYEGVTYKVKMITTMVKTKYGWKIDTFEYRDI
jgi:hypothetical protein